MPQEKATFATLSALFTEYRGDTHSPRLSGKNTSRAECCNGKEFVGGLRKRQNMGPLIFQTLRISVRRQETGILHRCLKIICITELRSTSPTLNLDLVSIQSFSI